MSVLVEALSLIVPRIVLDVSYPGGTDAFMNKMCEPDQPCRRICADDELVSVSFFRAEGVCSLASKLGELGIVSVDDEQFQEFAVVDQASGPTLPCDWLEWSKHEEGYTYCWKKGSDPSPMHTPADWTAEQSRALVWCDTRDEPGRCLQLSDKDGLEIWLDFQTGEIVEGLPHREDGAGKEPAQKDVNEFGLTAEEDKELEEEIDRIMNEDALFPIVRSALDARKRKYQDIGNSSLHSIWEGKKGSYAMVLRTDAKYDFVGIVARYGTNVPEYRRGAVAEATARANMRMSLGNFELDFDDGELKYRAGMDVEGGVLSETMVHNMIGAAIGALERYHEAFMLVAFGRADPKTALGNAT